MFALEFVFYIKVLHLLSRLLAITNVERHAGCQSWMPSFECEYLFESKRSENHWMNANCELWIVK